MGHDTVLMWAAATILAAFALVIAGVAIVVFGAALHNAINRWRINGLTAAEIRYVRRVAARLRERSKARDRNPKRQFDTWEFHDG